MKRALLLISAACAAIGLSACAQRQAPPNSTPASAETAEATAAATPSPAPTENPDMGRFVESDLLFSANGASFALRTDAAPLLHALGEDYQYEEAPSCVYDGFDKTFTYEGVTIYTNPDGEKDLINEIIVESPDYPTAKGVAVGDTLADAVAAYGDQYIDDNGVITYVLGGDPQNLASPRLLLYFEGDIISGIDYYYPTNITQ